jgi:hypothetical protein
VALVVLSLLFFDLEYLETVATQLTAAIVLGIYLSIFGVIFEMYKLQVASNEFQILRSTILTATTTALVYLLTPIFSLFSHQIVYNFNFFFVVFGSLIVWLFYVRFCSIKSLYANRYSYL